MLSLRRTADMLRLFGLELPGTHEDFPWGELVLKVRGKVFVFFGRASETDLRLSIKLPHSGDLLLDQEHAEPTGYGLGKSGWVTLTYSRGVDLDTDELCRWIEESYRAVAPRVLIQQLDAERGGPPPLPEIQPAPRRARARARTRKSAARPAASPASEAKVAKKPKSLGAKNKGSTRRR